MLLQRVTNKTNSTRRSVSNFNILSEYTGLTCKFEYGTFDIIHIAIGFHKFCDELRFMKTRLQHVKNAENQSRRLTFIEMFEMIEGYQ